MSIRFYPKLNLIENLRANKKNFAQISLGQAIKILIFGLVILSAPQNAFAWAGYEESTNIAIDIPPGNLVREGREIAIFDFHTNKYHQAEVIFLDDIFSGARLEVKDLETNEKRIFYMERQ